MTQGCVLKEAAGSPFPGAQAIDTWFTTTSVTAGVLQKVFLTCAGERRGTTHPTPSLARVNAKRHPKTKQDLVLREPSVITTLVMAGLINKPAGGLVSLPLAGFPQNAHSGDAREIR